MSECKNPDEILESIADELAKLPDETFLKVINLLRICAGQDKKLRDQIDRMKKCHNCRYDNSMTGCGRKCQNYNKWEWDGGE